MGSIDSARCLASDYSPLIALIVVNTGFFFAGIAIGPMFPAFILGAAKSRSYLHRRILCRTNSRGRAVRPDHIALGNDVSGARAGIGWLSGSLAEGPAAFQLSP